VGGAGRTDSICEMIEATFGMSCVETGRKHIVETDYECRTTHLVRFESVEEEIKVGLCEFRIVLFSFEQSEYTSSSQTHIRPIDCV